MSGQHNSNTQRAPFSIDLKCHRCGETGTSVWEENTRIGPDGPQTELISPSAGFYERLTRKRPHQIELVCHTCDAVQLG